MHGHGPPQSASLEDCHRQGIADAHQVANIDQQIDARNGAFLGQATQKCFRGAPILSRVHSEIAKRASPGRQGLKLAQGSLADALQSALLLLLVESLETRGGWTICYIPGQDSSADNLRESLQNVWVILENVHHCLHFSQHMLRKRSLSLITKVSSIKERFYSLRKKARRSERASLWE